MRSIPTGNHRFLKLAFTISIALVWFVNGLFCKLLNLVPRHQQIVARILGEAFAYVATKAIGVLELCMVVWIVSGLKPRLCSWTQIVVVETMFIIEVILVPDLLLFGVSNVIPISLFIGMVYVHGFILTKATPAPFVDNTPVS